MGGGDNTINGLLLIGENTMERIQRRFTRMLMDFSFVKRLNMADLFLLQQKGARGDMMELYQTKRHRKVKWSKCFPIIEASKQEVIGLRWGSSLKKI